MGKILSYPLIAEVQEKGFNKFVRSRDHTCFYDLNVGNHGQLFISVYYTHKKYLFKIRFRLPIGVTRYYVRFFEKHGSPINFRTNQKLKMFSKTGKALPDYLSEKDLKVLKPFLPPKDHKAILHYIRQKAILEKKPKSKK